jgi:hypothetical protein
MKLIDRQLQKENLIDFDNNKSLFIRKWVFVISWTIKNTNWLLLCVLSLTENEEQTIIELKSSIWKKTYDLFRNI